ncbi:membrane protein, partial [Candidatus Magnetomorum sp. HK-1]
MYYEEPPFFKKTFLPWYNSDSMCLLKICLMSLTMAFAVIGIQVANTLPTWYGLKGIPYALLILSGIVFLIN